VPHWTRKKSAECKKAEVSRMNKLAYNNGFYLEQIKGVGIVADFREITLH